MCFRLEAVTVRAECFEIARVVVLTVAINVVDIELALVFRDKAAPLTHIFPMYSVRAPPSY